MTDIIVWLGVLVIAGVVIWFLLSQADLPEPIKKIIVIVIVVVIGVLAIGFLLSFAGHGGSFRLPR